MQPIIYTAGPVTGLTQAQALGWRQQVVDALSDLATIHNPVPKPRAPTIEECNYSIEEQEQIFQDCYLRVRDCDFLLVNLAGTSARSIGTCFEVAWGFQFGKPTFLVLDERHDHLFFRSSGRVFTSLDAALLVLRQALLKQIC